MKRNNETPNAREHNAYPSAEEQARAYFNQAYQLHTQGRLQRAIALYEQSLELYPTAEAHTFMGWAYSHLGEYERAIEECKQAIELDPDYGNPYNDIGAYLMELGRADEAEEWLVRATTAPRYETPFFPRFNLGRLCERQGKWFEALDEYKAAFEIAKQHNIEYNVAAIAHLNLQARLN